MKKTFFGLMCASLLLCGCPKGTKKAPVAETKTTTTETTAVEAAETDNAADSLTKPKTTTMKKAIIKTGKGTLKADLYSEETPGTVENFCKLANSGFYNGLTFHRVIPNFVIQGGCPNGDGSGGPGYTIKCETSGGKQHHDRGVLSMAHRGKDTGGSQFFICLSREQTAHLDGVHTCFGKVYEGLDILDKIKQGDVIESITIIEE